MIREKIKFNGWDIITPYGKNSENRKKLKIKF
jgi:hypothetical protein